MLKQQAIANLEDDVVDEEVGGRREQGSNEFIDVTCMPHALIDTTASEMCKSACLAPATSSAECTLQKLSCLCNIPADQKDQGGRGCVVPGLLMKSGERKVSMEPPRMPPMRTEKMPQMKNKLRMSRSRPDSEHFLHSNCSAHHKAFVSWLNV